MESEAIVLVHPVVPWQSGPVPLGEIEKRFDSLRDEFYDWMAPSKYCPVLPELQPFITEIEARCDGTARGFAETAATVVNEKFTYKPGATHVNSSVEDILSTSAGVCQDFSHLLISILRQRGLPARYVSGYLVPRQKVLTAEEGQRAAMENVIGGQASHAWVQANIPDSGWIGLDPTVGYFVDEQHIIVARGRDYGDVTPMRGVYKGHAGQSLSVDVLVRPALDDEGSELLQETAAAPPPRPDPTIEQQQQQQQQ